MSMRVCGEHEVGEAAKAAAVVQRRLLGFSWAVPAQLAIMLLGGGVFGVAAILVGDAMGRDVDATIPGVIGLWLGWFVGRRVWFNMTVRHNRRRLRERGVPSPAPVAYEVGEDALTVTLGAVTRICRWGAVSEVFQVEGYWIFLVQSEALYLARRLFASPEEERRFIAEVWARLDGAAQRRSPETRRWLGLPAAASGA